MIFESFAIGSELGFGYRDGFVAGGFLALGGGLEVGRVTGGFAGFALSSAADRTVGHMRNSISESGSKEKAR